MKRSIISFIDASTVDSYIQETKENGCSAQRLTFMLISTETLSVNIKVISIGISINSFFTSDKNRSHGPIFSGRCLQDFKNSDALHATKNSLELS